MLHRRDPGLGQALSAKQIANKVLRLDPRKPADVDLFTSKAANRAQGLYPAGSAMAPASGPVLSEQQVRSRLKMFLKGHFRNDAGKVNAALAVFDDPDTKSLIPDPQPPGAAVVGMKGILLPPTINLGLSSGRFGLVRYGTLPDPNGVAVTTGGSGSRIVTVNRKYASEDFRYLIAVMGHEFLRDDASNSPAEEAINTSLTAMTYLKIVVSILALAIA